MHFYLHYNREFDDNILNLWFNHYNRLNMKYGIFVEERDMEYYKQKYTLYSKKLIETIPENVIQITEKDFLFSYEKTDDDIMMLSYNVNAEFYNEFENKSSVIGRVFNVPVQQKNIHSTYEIPDFIIHRHANHTNFTVDGLKINGGGNPSESIVCLNMNISKVAFENEYYETNIIINPDELSSDDSELYFRIVYVYFCNNIMVNKEKLYGIIWYPKCACTTITNLFCLVNNIHLEEHKSNRLLNCHTQKYRYNCYLQNIELVSFVRNPYERVLSSFIDKHVFKTDDTFLQLTGYLEYRRKFSKDCILNLCYYLLNKRHISDHYVLYSHANEHIPYFKKLKSTIFKIEENLNENLCVFFKKYHTNVDEIKIVNEHENSICRKNNSNGKMNEIDKNMKNFDETQWRLFLDGSNINYKMIINGDDELKSIIYNIFREDFIKFGYRFNL
jgi:hypothetical protein